MKYNIKTKSKIRYKSRTKKQKKSYQSGGVIKIQLDEWTKISAPGSNNCGIFISNKYPTLILKCVRSSSKSKILTTQKINSFIKLFVDIYDEQLIGGKYYIIMQKFSGTLLNIFGDYFPKYVLNDMIKIGKINNIQKDNILKIFKYTSDEVSARSIIIDNIEIEKEVYNLFIDTLFKVWDKYYFIICKEVVKIELLLLELGYFYDDIKFENFGYILTNTPIITDFRSYNVPKIFNQYLYIYFIDIDGYRKLHSEDLDYTMCFQEILSNINEGRYQLPEITKPYNMDELKLTNSISNILKTKYIFNTDKYNHEFKNISDIEQYIFNNNDTLKTLKNILNIEAPYYLLRSMEPSMPNTNWGYTYNKNFSNTLKIYDEELKNKKNEAHRLKKEYLNSISRYNNNS